MFGFGRPRTVRHVDLTKLSRYSAPQLQAFVAEQITRAETPADLDVCFRLLNVVKRRLTEDQNGGVSRDGHRDAGNRHARGENQQRHSK